MFKVLAIKSFRTNLTLKFKSLSVTVSVEAEGKKD